MPWRGVGCEGEDSGCVGCPDCPDPTRSASLSGDFEVELFCSENLKTKLLKLLPVLSIGISFSVWSLFLKAKETSAVGRMFY